MLAIRMQRTGRKGYATFRIIVQDSKFSPTSGRVVAKVGYYNPHTKEKSIDADVVAKYLKEGAQPTPRVVRLLLAEKIAMPDWVATPDNTKKSKVKNAEKLRKNQPKEEPAAPIEDEKSKNEDTATEVPATEDTPAPEAEAKPETTQEEPVAEAEAPKEEKPAEEPAKEDAPKEA